jgi:hypothetical protein
MTPPHAIEAKACTPAPRIQPAEKWLNATLFFILQICLKNCWKARLILAGRSSLVFLPRIS